MDDPTTSPAEREVLTAAETTRARRGTTYRPRDLTLPDQFLPNPEYIVVRPYPGAGSGLTLMLNYLLREHGNYDEFGGRGFYYLVKKHTQVGHDVREKESEAYAYSMPEVMAAWQKHGLVPEALWPSNPKGDETLTPEQAETARRYHPVTYQKVPKDVNAVKAALVDRHAVVAGFLVHEGWQTGVREGVIDFKPNKPQILGGHGIAILGYTPRGFLIQNVWGPDWGRVTVIKRIQAPPS